MRLLYRLLSIGLLMTVSISTEAADRPVTGAQRPGLQKLAVPANRVSSIATRLNLQYQSFPGVHISADVQNEQLLVMAPPETLEQIEVGVQAMLAADANSAATHRSALRLSLSNISSQEFETRLQQLAGDPLPVTTSAGGSRAAFQLTSPQLRGTTIELDRRTRSVTVTASSDTLPAWETLIRLVDDSQQGADRVIELVRFENAEPAPIQKAIRLLRGITPVAAPIADGQPRIRNAVFQQQAAGQGAENQAGTDVGDAADEDSQEGGTGLLGNPEIQIIPELGQVIIKGSKRDAQRIMDLIQQIEQQSKLTKPDIEIIPLEHADGNAVAGLLKQLYEDVLSARQGEVSITPLDTPNALLLIGRSEAIAGVRELIDKIDQPIAESSRLRVYRLQHASAAEAEQIIRDFLTDRPGSGDELRPGLGPRVRVLSDYRTNSLIISAAPRDLLEVTRLINELDIQEIPAQSQIKIFPLHNAIAEDLAPVLQTAINGQPEGDSDDANPSTSISIVTIDSDTNQVLDSGVLRGAVVTADSGANAIVVRAPAASMPLIGELVRQLDRAPGVDSLVKVFTIENGDALQLTTALQDLFGSDAASTGTGVGALNAAGLPPASAATESSLVPLRFSTDQRTNSIIASGSAEDLEVVESILLRLDSAGFAERITEVIWLRHQTALDIATAIQAYVQQRTQTVNTIQQFQQGLGPYDLPDRDLIVVPEPTSNSLLLSVSPRLYEDVRRMIDKLDRRAPMVMIQVMLAEVRLGDIFEIGGEFGLQDSLLYDRGVAASALPSAGPPSVPGFNFNNIGQPNANSFRRGNVGSQGVTSFGVGTTNSALGYGGFVLSAASDSVSLLLRTLQDAERLQILSRPQINTMDNNEAIVQVGRTIARVTDVINNGVAGTQVVTTDVPVGLILRVLPRVGSDGLIVMNIDVTRSDRDNNNGTAVPTSDGILIIDDILETTAQSVVAAYNGQTVVFGGLIQKTRSNFSRRIPYVSDIPLIGYLFKYDQETEFRNELLLVMTPTLISGQEDLDYIKEVESSRMSWCLADVVEAHGDVGLSGGYGLWGPAIGNTIYPDLQPTVDELALDPACADEELFIDQSVIMHDESPRWETPEQTWETFESEFEQPSTAPLPPPTIVPTPTPTPAAPIDSPPWTESVSHPDSRFTPLDQLTITQQPTTQQPAVQQTTWQQSAWQKFKPDAVPKQTAKPARLGTRGQ
jgi:type II secretory pathway component GspD/PulD (secretin)